MAHVLRVKCANTRTLEVRLVTLYYWKNCESHKDGSGEYIVL
jgi:hypothetical protein